jgi:hypothetical protein
MPTPTTFIGPFYRLRLCSPIMGSLATSVVWVWDNGLSCLGPAVSNPTHFDHKETIQTGKLFADDTQLSYLFLLGIIG